MYVYTYLYITLFVYLIVYVIIHIHIFINVSYFWLFLSFFLYVYIYICRYITLDVTGCYPLGNHWCLLEMGGYPKMFHGVQKILNSDKIKWLHGDREPYCAVHGADGKFAMDSGGAV